MGAERWDPFQDPAEDEGPVPAYTSPKLLYEPIVKQEKGEEEDEGANDPKPSRPRRIVAAGVQCQLAPPVSESRKMRILCLHDHVSSSNILEFQLNPAISRMVDDAEFIKWQGTMLVSRGTARAELAPEYVFNRMMWGGEILYDYADAFLEDQDGQQMRIYGGLEEALYHIHAGLMENGPVDAILGSGQGADLATLVAASSCLGRMPPLRCAVIVSPNRPGWVKQMPDLFQQKIHLPTMIMYGMKDKHQAVPEVAALFEKPEIMSHTDSYHYRVFPSPGKETDKQAIMLARYMKEFLLHYARCD